MGETASAADGSPWILPRNGRTSGTLAGATIREGFGVAMSDLVYHEDVEINQLGGDFLKLHCKLEGDSGIRGEDGELQPVQAGRISFLVQPHASWKHEQMKAESHARSVTLICSRDFASSLLPERSNQLPSSIREFLEARTSQFSFASIPLPLEARKIAEDMLQTPETGKLGELMLEGKALELLCLTIHQILNVPPAGGIVRNRDLVKVRDLCAYLETNPGSTLGIAELCRLVAWNETQMMECFKQVTGTTISNYRHRLRMEHALHQLQTTEASITEVAFDAGYEHPSNFATAFKRTFGCPPRLARAQLR